MLRLLFPVLVMGSLAGCAGGPALVGGPGLEIVDTHELPPPSHVGLASDERAYRLGAFDRIQVSVFGQEQLSRETERGVMLDSAAGLSLPLVGYIRAAGLTPYELSELIAERLRENHVRDPQVSVNLVEAVSQVVTVEGAVMRPGHYPVLGDMSLMRAVASAEGTTEFARLNEVVVFRDVGEQRMAALYSLRSIRAGIYEDPEIFAGDLVVVGDSPARRLFRDITSASALLTAPLVAFVRR